MANHAESFKSIREKFSLGLTDLSDAAYKKVVNTYCREVISENYFDIVGIHVAEELVKRAFDNGESSIILTPGTKINIEFDSKFADSLTIVNTLLSMWYPYAYRTYDFSASGGFLEDVVEDLNKDIEGEYRFHIDQPMLQRIYYIKPDEEEDLNKIVHRYQLFDRKAEIKALADWKNYKDAPKGATIEKVTYSFDIKIY